VPNVGVKGGARHADAEMTNLNQLAEKRRVPRQRTLLSAKAVFNGSSSTLNCTVRNMTDLGCRLDFPEAVGIPEIFRLQIMANPLVDCTVIWKSGSSRGVAFG